MTWAYLDGSYLPAAEARLAAADAGLLYSRGLFETFRARRGAVYRLEDHLGRLRSGARLLGIVPPDALTGLAEIVRELARRCGIDDARVRLTLTAGPEGGQPSLLIQVRAAMDYPESLYQRGVSAVVAAVRRNERSPLSRVKSLNYLDNILAREWAQATGADAAILLNTRGLLTEASTSNLFVIREGELLTPPVEDGALPGVTRGAVLELARDAGIAVREKSLTLGDLRMADEAFLTNAVMGVMPLVSVDGARVGDGRPGPLTARIRGLYEAATT